MQIIFESLEDMIVNMPKLMDLISGSGSLEERFARVTDPHKIEEMVLKVPDPVAKEKATKPVSASAEPEQKETEKPKTKKTSSKAEKPAETATEPVKEAPAKEEKANPVVKDTDVRMALNTLLKGGRRDAVQKILKSFKAENFSGLQPADYAAVIEEAKRYKDMPAEDYEKALRG